MKSAQLCPTLCDPMDCSLPDSVHGTFQARILEWVAFSRGSPGDLPDPGMKPRSPALQADSLLSEPPGKPPVKPYIDSIKCPQCSCATQYHYHWILKTPQSSSEAKGRKRKHVPKVKA